jgi:hypothetical protein
VKYNKKLEVDLLKLSSLAFSCHPPILAFLSKQCNKENKGHFILLLFLAHNL